MYGVTRDSDITLSSRYECKYIVSPIIVPAVREFLTPFMRPDMFAARWPDRRYPICSLYLDSEDLLLYQQTVGGEKNRFKLRVRSYTDAADAPVFFEVKRKINNIVQKRRARIERSRVSELLRSGMPRWREHVETEDADDLHYFTNHAALVSARPLIRVRYLREAHESRSGDPVRVTIDTELMHAVTLDDDIRQQDGRWVGTPVGGAIIEIKFTERFPGWIADLVRVFGLKQQPVPKYVLSVDHMLMHGREAVLAVGGFRLPVRRA